MTETFVKERKHTGSGKVEPVKIDDACSFFCRFENGSLGLFESTRYARGHKALYTFEINGEHASIKWDLHDLHRLEFFDYNDPGILRGWKSIHVTDGDHPYMKQWWVPGLQIGYEHTFVHQVADFLQGLASGKPTQAPPSAKAAEDPSRLRRRARLGRGRQVGGRGAGLNENWSAWRTLQETAMKTGMNLLLWTDHVTAEHDGLLEQIKGFGFDAVEIPIFNTDDMAAYERLGKRLRSLGLGATAVTVMGPETNPISPDPAIRKAAVAYLDKVMECGQAFGCEILCGPIHSAIGVFSGQGADGRRVQGRRRHAPPGGREGRGAEDQARRRIPQPLRDLLPHDRRGGVAIRPRGEPSLPEDDVRQLPRAHRGEGSIAAIASCAAETIHVHVSENDRGVPGTGQVNWDSFWNGLEASGYNGYVTIEAFGRALPALAAATRVWRDLFPDAMGLCRDGLAFIKGRIGA